MMSSSQIQDPHRLTSAPTLHVDLNSPPISSASSSSVSIDRNENTPGFIFQHTLQSISPHMIGQIPDQDSNNPIGGGVYSMPFAFHSGFRPFYVGVPGGAALPIVTPQPIHAQSSPPNLPQGNSAPTMAQNVTQNASQTLPQSIPQNIPQGVSSAMSPVMPSAMPSAMSPGMSQVMTPGFSTSGSPAIARSPNFRIPIAPKGVDLQTARSLASTQQHMSAGSPGHHHDSYRPKDLQLSKRTKVSRACDECRRKKTRCDVEPNHEVCTPCSRANVPCTFARAQLKRGPAKKRPSFSSVPAATAILSHGHNNHSSKEKHTQLSASRKRSQSAPGALAESQLPPIEALLGYSNMNGALANVSIASPGVGYASSPKPGNGNSIGNGNGNGNGNAITNSYTGIQIPREPPREIHKDYERMATPSTSSSFPILVEVACHSSQSPSIKEEERKMGMQSPSETTTAKPQTPPAHYDASEHGISHHALIEYYTFVHPTFPLLPDLVGDLDDMFSSSGPAKDHLVAAINGTSSDIPFSLPRTGQPVSITARESHIIALLFTYLRTLDVALLSASVAACTPLVAINGNQNFSGATPQLAATIVILDRLHSAVFDTPSLVPEYLFHIAQSCRRLLSTLELFGITQTPVKGEVGSPSPDQQFVTAPQAALAVFGKVLQHQIPREDARNQLKSLIAQLQRTPLQNFAIAFSSMSQR